MKRQRRAFSLMEVILSIAILAAATVLLGELTRFGMRNARAARDLTRAQLLCDSKLNEVIAGIETTDPVSGAKFDTAYDADAEWTYSIASSVLDDVTGLTSVTVTVNQDLPASQKPVQFALTRWMIPISSASTSEEGSTDSSSSSSTTSGNSGSGSSSSGSGSGSSGSQGGSQ